MADRMEWGPKYSIGIEEIDKQHKFLFDLVNELYDNKDTTGNERNVFLKSFLARLSNYVVLHFETEEVYMNSVSYDKKNHIIEHRDFLYVVFDVLKLYNKEKTIDMNAISIYLHRWLIDHIGGTDYAFGNFYKKANTGN